MRLRLIACEIAYRELCSLVAASPHIVDLEFLPKGLHDQGAKPMRAALQAAIDATDAGKYEAVLLGYALCGNGVVGLEARHLPLIVPRAHDCMTFFMGSKERYQQYFSDNTGVYFRTTGWLERAESLDQLSVQKLNGMDASYEDLIAKYGEENAHYLYDQLRQYLYKYRQLTFIEMGVEPDDSFEQRAREEAESRGWAFEKLQGDMGLLRRLVNGPWEENEFVIAKPGQRIAAQYDEQIIRVEDITG